MSRRRTVPAYLLLESNGIQPLSSRSRTPCEPRFGRVCVNEMNAMSVLKTRSGRTIKLRDPAQNGCDVVLVSAALLAHNRRRREKVYRGRANDRV